MFAFSELVLIRRCVKWHSFRRPEIVAALAALIVSASLVPFTSTARAGGDAELISGKPIKVGTDGGVGPLAVPSLRLQSTGGCASIRRNSPRPNRRIRPVASGVIRISLDFRRP